jgi:hypothetical protein
MGWRCKSDQSRTYEVSSPEQFGHVFESTEIDTSGLSLAEVAHGLYMLKLASEVQEHEFGARSTDGLEASYET